MTEVASKRRDVKILADGVRPLRLPLLVNNPDDRYLLVLALEDTLPIVGVALWEARRAEDLKALAAAPRTDDLEIDNIVKRSCVWFEYNRGHKKSGKNIGC